MTSVMTTMPYKTLLYFLVSTRALSLNFWSYLCSDFRSKRIYWTCLRNKFCSCSFSILATEHTFSSPMLRLNISHLPVTYTMKLFGNQIASAPRPRMYYILLEICTISNHVMNINPVTVLGIVKLDTWIIRAWLCAQLATQSNFLPCFLHPS